MFNVLNAYLKSGDGATAVEYALFAAGIAMAIVFVVFDLGDSLVEMMNTLADSIASSSEA
jgi:Flp pilus assembly pilin Flp